MTPQTLERKHYWRGLGVVVVFFCLGVWVGLGLEIFWRLARAVVCQ